jgi:type IV secretion system protein VirB9
MRPSRLIFVLLPVASAAGAQDQSFGVAGDPRLQQVDYDAGHIVRLQGAPGFQTMIELSPDEQVQSVAIGDTAAWQVSADKAGNRLFLKATQPGSVTNMTVVTSVRVYSFDLAALQAPSMDMPYMLRFRYPEAKAPATDRAFVDVSAVTRRLSRYRLSGDRALWPQSVTDDGLHTYSAWPKNAALPAVYAVGRAGEDVMVNGMMRPDDVYVLDGAPAKLTFRVDGSVAHAVRTNPRKNR